MLGLAAMIGAGVFTAFPPAAAAAGPLLPLALVLAAVVAFCNATSTAQLAAMHPVSGGAYAYGRAELGEWAGFLAGWGFVIGKTASSAAMALAFATYAVPAPIGRPVALAALLVLTAVNCLGITRTAAVATVIVGIALTAIGVAVAAAWALPGVPAAGDAIAATPYGVLQAAGLIFFAFAGYARIATLGEEVRSPERTIPRAIGIAFAVALAVYAVVAVSLLRALGTGLAATAAPLAVVAAAPGGTAGAAGALVVAIGAAAASLGALLALLAGIGRTALAMARQGDLPRGLAVLPRDATAPRRALIAAGAAACLLVLAADLRTAIGFSSFGVLVYYLVANLAALRQSGPARRYPRVLQLVGAAGCVALVATVPVPSLIAGVVVFAVGAAGRLIVIRRRAASGPRG